MSETTNKSTETKFYNKFVNSVGGLYLNAKQVFSAIPKACTLWIFPHGGRRYVHSEYVTHYDLANLILTSKKRKLWKIL